MMWYSFTAAPLVGSKRLRRPWPALCLPVCACRPGLLSEIADGGNVQSGERDPHSDDRDCLLTEPEPLRGALGLGRSASSCLSLPRSLTAPSCSRPLQDSGVAALELPGEALQSSGVVTSHTCSAAGTNVDDADLQVPERRALDGVSSVSVHHCGARAFVGSSTPPDFGHYCTSRHCPVLPAARPRMVPHCASTIWRPIDSSSRASSRRALIGTSPSLPVPASSATA